MSLLSLTVRHPTTAELWACSELCLRVFGGKNPTPINQAVCSPTSCVLAAFAGDKVVGTGRIERIIEATWLWQISSLAVERQYRHRYSIGTHLMIELERYGAVCGAVTVQLAALPSARLFYEQLGYVRQYPENNRSNMMFKDL